jgi:predicted DNA binding CopG/RHH family protein
MKLINKVLNFFSLQHEEKNMTTTTAKNYTDAQTAELIAEYTTKDTNNKTFNETFAEKFGKTTRSIVAKLSKEGVYKVEVRKTKTGEKVITKAELVAQINNKLGVEMDSLVKATKADLQNLVNSLT